METSFGGQIRYLARWVGYPGPNYHSSNLWGIASTRESFADFIGFRVGQGRRSFFGWTLGSKANHWMRNIQICSDAQEIAKLRFHLTLIKTVVKLQWDPIFRKNHTELRETNLFILLDILSQASILEDYSDGRTWNASQDGVFSVLSFFIGISRGALSSSPLFNLWKIIAPPRVTLLDASFARRCLDHGQFASL